MHLPNRSSATSNNRTIAAAELWSERVVGDRQRPRTLSGEMQVCAHRLWLLPLSVVVVGAGYETAVAVGALNVGPLPGAEPPGRRAVFLAAELALLVASVAAARIPIGRRGGAAVVMLPPAAAAFLLARFFSFDAYYAPTLRRMSDDGLVPPGLVWLLAGGCAVASVLLHSRPRAGFVLTAPLLCLVAVTAVVAGVGH